MKRNITRLIRISLYLHLFYFILLLLLFLCQRPIHMIFGRYEECMALPPLILAYDILFLILHMVLAVILEKKINCNTSLAAELTGVVLFGGVLYCLDTIANRILYRLVGLYGHQTLANYSIFNQAQSLIRPIRMIAVTLLILAIGMSMYRKLDLQGKEEQMNRWIPRLLWGSLVMEGLFYLIMMIIMMFQNILKAQTGLSELRFVLPVDWLAGGFVLLVLHAALTAELYCQFKQNGKNVIGEVLGTILYSGMLGWLDWFLYRIFIKVMLYFIEGTIGIEGYVDYLLVSRMITSWTPLQMAGRCLVLICCGMLFYKKMGKKGSEDRL